MCYKNNVSSWCNECQQWLCESCRETHVRIPACKNHKLTTIALKNKEVKAKIDEESKGIKDHIRLYAELIAEIEDRIKGLESKQTNSLQQLDILRNKAIQDIKNYFDSLDAKVLEFVQRNIEQLNKERFELDAAHKRLSKQWNELENMLSGQLKTLAIDGNTILENIRK